MAALNNTVVLDQVHTELNENLFIVTAVFHTEKMQYGFNRLRLRDHLALRKKIREIVNNQFRLAGEE